MDISASSGGSGGQPLYDPERRRRCLMLLGAAIEVGTDEQQRRMLNLCIRPLALEHVRVQTFALDEIANLIEGSLPPVSPLDTLPLNPSSTDILCYAVYRFRCDDVGDALTELIALTQCELMDAHGNVVSLGKSAI